MKNEGSRSAGLRKAFGDALFPLEKKRDPVG